MHQLQKFRYSKLPISEGELLHVVVYSRIFTMTVNLILACCLGQFISIADQNGLLRMAISCNTWLAVGELC